MSSVGQHWLANIFWYKSLDSLDLTRTSALCRWDLLSYLLCVPAFWVERVNKYDSFWPVLCHPIWEKWMRLLKVSLSIKDWKQTNLMGVLWITGDKMTRKWFVPALWKMLRPFLQLIDQMCFNVYLDEHVCKDSLPGGTGVAILLSWLTQLAAPFPTHCSDYPILQSPALWWKAGSCIRLLSIRDRGLDLQCNLSVTCFLIQRLCFIKELFSLWHWEGLLRDNCLLPSFWR